MYGGFARAWPDSVFRLLAFRLRVCLSLAARCELLHPVSRAALLQSRTLLERPDDTGWRHVLSVASIHTVRLLNPLAALIHLLDSDTLDDSGRGRHRSYALSVPMVRVPKQMAGGSDYYLRLGRHRSRRK